MLQKLTSDQHRLMFVSTAFGIFARILSPEGEFGPLEAMTQGIKLADSITVDGHKVLNVVGRR